jgi:hypothetical protein
MTVRPLIMVLALSAVAGGLSACGKTGELERPAPMFGSQAKADYDKEKADAAAAKAHDAETRRSEQGNTVFDPVDGPPTQAPYAPGIPGRTDPLGPAPQTPGAGSNTAPDQ